MSSKCLAILQEKPDPSFWLFVEMKGIETFRTVFIGTKKFGITHLDVIYHFLFRHLSDNVNRWSEHRL